jgi:hypothetical protein
MPDMNLQVIGLFYKEHSMSHGPFSEFPNVVNLMWANPQFVLP